MPIQRSYRFLPGLLLTAVLAGCATTGANMPNANVPVAAYRDTVDFTGALSVTYEQEGQTKNDSVRYSWSQRPGNIDVTISGPLGQTLATIQVTPQAATLTQPDRVPRTARDIDTLTSQTLGYALPVNGLRDWMQGYATDAKGQRFRASPAQNEVFTSDGWRLRFAEWQDNAGTPMPRRIRAGRSATADSGELTINISITPAG
jgi:outer membrane lipoprotein LolB